MRTKQRRPRQSQWSKKPRTPRFCEREYGSRPRTPQEQPDTGPNGPEPSSGLLEVRQWIRDRCIATTQKKGIHPCGFAQAVWQELRIYVSDFDFVTAAVAEGYEVIKYEAGFLNSELKMKLRKLEVDND